jgi:hypothetical protein
MQIAKQGAILCTFIYHWSGEATTARRGGDVLARAGSGAEARRVSGGGAQG